MMWLCPSRAPLSPQLSGRLCWSLLLINREFGGSLLIFLLLSAPCRAPLCWGLLCDAILGAIFQIRLTPTALVELQRGKSIRIQSFWQKSVPSAFPSGFPGHSFMSPSGHRLPRRCCRGGGVDCWGSSCATSSQVNQCCWLGCPGVPQGFKGRQAELGKLELAGWSPEGSGQLPAWRG